MQSSALNVVLQDSAERLGQDTIQYEESPGSILEASKNIASMWTTMAQLIRSELSILICTRII